MNLKILFHETLHVGLGGVTVDCVRTVVQKRGEGLVAMRDGRAMGPS